MEIKITFTDGGNLGEDYVLDLSEPRVLGRTHTNAVVVSREDIDVSKQHLEFRAAGGGAVVGCLSDNGFFLNGRNVPRGESRPLRKGDELRLGKRVRIRVDRVGVSDGGNGRRPDGSETAVTAMTAQATVATGMSGAATAATRAAGDARTFSGTVVETPIGEAPSVAPTRFNLSAAATDAGVTAPDAVTGADAPTGGADGPMTFSGADAPSFSGTAGDDVTVPQATRFVNRAVFDAIAEEKERARRFKQRLLTLAAFGAIAVLAVLVYAFWPRAERWLAHPKPYAHHIVKAPAGTPRLFVDFPQNARTRTSARANGGIDVETLTGSARDVPFRLSFDVRCGADELDLSLEDSSAREIAALRKQGYVFSPVGADGGFSFFERDYPKSCEDGGVQRGVRFCHREFTRTDGSGQWHGILLYFRDVDTVYRLLREIPETEWPRGEWLLRQDPNLALYAGFLESQWESPGAKELAGYAGRRPTELFEQIDASFERDIPSEWKETERKIDALVLAGLRGDADVLAEGRKRLRTLRRTKDLFYDECRARHEMGERREAFAKAWGAFGNDAGDLRSRLLADPKEWRRE